MRIFFIIVALVSAIGTRDMASAQTTAPAPLVLATEVHVRANMVDQYETARRGAPR